ncbi:MAG: PadR family transcriptional regulator [Bacillota bacterium]
MPADGGGRRQELLPLTESTFYILISLVRPRHGYGIIQAVREMSGGRVDLGPGTLYGALNRLLRQGLIARTEEEGAQDERRKLYLLTARGRDLLRLEIGRLRAMVRHGEEALGEEDKE